MNHECYMNIKKIVKSSLASLTAFSSSPPKYQKDRQTCTVTYIIAIANYSLGFTQFSYKEHVHACIPYSYSSQIAIQLLCVGNMHPYSDICVHGKHTSLGIYVWGNMYPQGYVCWKHTSLGMCVCACVQHSFKTHQIVIHLQ